jgi:hypothetical protein
MDTSLGASLVRVPQYFARKELLSSTGVKMLLALIGRFGSAIKP